MSEQDWREFLAADGVVEKRVAAALTAGGRVVWESEEHWTLADRPGTGVCITAWPDGGTKAPPDPA